MAKDVVYIDAKDDITSIIDKVKQSSQKIVALVPPKQVGVLQSAVNLQLLVHEAKRNQKVLVIITGQETLIRLAAVAGVPIAKTLTSKPEMPEVPALKVDGEDDIIDGAKISIGELSGLPTEEKEASSDFEAKEEVPKLAPAKIKVPNYDKFRKRLLIGGACGVVLITFLIWALVFAPKAEIVISTTSKAINISSGATLVEKTDEQNYAENILAAQTQKITKKRVYEFQVTGEKDLKVAASGSLSLENYRTTSVAIKAGTKFTKGSCTFATQADVTVPAAVGSFLGNHTTGKAKVGVQATVTGESCNIEAGDYSSSVSDILAKGTVMTGGTERKVKVMTQSDYDKAKAELTKEGNETALKELRNKFDSSTTLINDSLAVKEGEIKTNFKIDEEVADGKIKMEQENNYQITGLTNKVLTEYLSHIALRDNKDSKVYDTGINDVVFKDFVITGGKTTVRISSQVKIGPNIDVQKVKEVVKGKPQSEIRNHYLTVDGIKDVRVSFSPFWVSSAPNNIEKISVVVEN
ncbi:MAG: hypothetical protein Q3996_01935 [Candidatus Saccharibacteria bacterium]|nr:hypothetical protein [Candidatus Saccharibacteria bacterium]